MEHKLALERLIDAINNDVDIGEIERLVLHPMLNINATFGDLGLRPIHHAVHKDRIDCVEMFLRYRCNIQLRDKCGFSALHFATRRGNIDMMSLLIRRGADVHAEDLLGFTALHIALQKGNSDCAELLLKNGGNPNMYYKDLGFEIHLLRGDAPRCLELLLEYGARTAAVDVKGLTPLHVAAQSGNLIYTYILLKNGADPNAVTSTAGRLKTDSGVGKTALQIAAIAAETKIVEILLLFGADTNCRDNHMNTPLHFASAHGNVEIMKMLVKHGASVRALNERSFTPLHRACSSVPQHMNLEVLRLLFQYGAYANAFNYYDETPIQCLLQKSQQCMEKDQGELKTTSRENQLRQILLELINNNAKFTITDDQHDMFNILQYIPMIQDLPSIRALLLEAASSIHLSLSDDDLPEDITPDLLCHLRVISNQPRSLKWTARNEIRKRIINLKFESIDQLQFPFYLKRYIHELLK